MKKLLLFTPKRLLLSLLLLVILLSLGAFFGHAYLKEYIKEELETALYSVGIEDVSLELNELGISSARIDSLKASHIGWELDLRRVEVDYHLSGLSNEELDALEIDGGSITVNIDHLYLEDGIDASKTPTSTAWLPKLLNMTNLVLDVTFNGVERLFDVEAHFALDDSISGWVEFSHENGSHVMLSISKLNDIILEGDFPNNENWLKTPKSLNGATFDYLRTSNLSFAFRSYPEFPSELRSWAGEVELELMDTAYGDWSIHAVDNKILATGIGKEFGDVYLSTAQVVLGDSITLNELTANYKNAGISGKIAKIEVSRDLSSLSVMGLSYTYSEGKEKQLKVHAENLALQGVELTDVRTELILPNENEIFCRAEAKVGTDLGIFISAEAMIYRNDFSKGLISGGFDVPKQDIENGILPENLGVLSRSQFSGSIQGGGTFTSTKQGFGIKGDILFSESLIVYDKNDLSIAGLNGNIEFNMGDAVRINTASPLLFTALTYQGWMLTDGMLDLLWRESGNSTFELSGTYGGGEVRVKASLDDKHVWTIEITCKNVSVSAISDRIQDFKGTLKGGSIRGSLKLLYIDGTWQSGGGNLSLSQDESSQLHYPADGWLSARATPGSDEYDKLALTEHALTNFELQSLNIQVYPESAIGPKIIITLSGISVESLRFMGADVGQVPIGELKVRINGPLRQTIKMLLDESVSNKGISISY